MSIRTKIITAILSLSLVAVMVPTGVVQGALTESQIQSILSLLTSFGADATTVANVDASLRGTTPTTPTTPTTITGIPAGFTFTQTLQYGSVDSDVVYLKIVLAAEGCVSGLSNTTYFGSSTKAGVQCFQQKYGTGSLGTTGPNTRAKLNALIAGGIVIPPIIPPTTAGGLSVGLSADSPASGSVPNNGNANFTKVTLTAGSGDVSISRIYVTRTGLSSNSALENIKVVDAATGVYFGSIGSLNTDNKAMITFTQNLVISANTSRSFYLKAGFVSSTTTAPGGNTAALGIAAASDITSNAMSVTGSFPVTGNPMSVVNLTIGSAAVAEDGTTVDSKPNVGDTGIVLNQFTIGAGSTEAITVEAITMVKAGTVSNSYLSNLELYDVTNSVTLGTVASLNAEGKAAWTNLNLVIGKGDTRRFKIKSTIVDGPSLTANADIVDGSEVLVVVKGNTYGYYITPTATGSWGGQGAANQTINAGALVVSKSSSTPATGNTSAGDGKLISVFDFNARGEAVKISSLLLTATLGTMTYGQVTNVKVYDENGTIVAGPKDLAVGTVAGCGSITTCGTVTFTDTFIVPVGTHKYSVKAKLASDVSADDTIKFAIATGGATDITAKGMTSNSTITATGTATGNTLTVKGATLSITSLSSPASRSVAVGTPDFVYSTISLSAINSGEDIQVTGITVLDDVTADAYPSDLSNMAIWADLTSANSARGDVYETRITNTENPTVATSTDTVQSFTLNQTITISAGGFVNIAVVASLKAGALTTSSPIHKLGIAGATATGVVTANGASTGTAATKTYSVTNIQSMTNASGGALTITKDSTSPVADLILGNSTVTLAVFRLASSNIENLDVDDMTLTVTGGTSIDTYYFYNGTTFYNETTLLGSTAGGETPKLVLTDGALTVPANGYVKVTVKGALAPITSGSTATSITATIQGSAQVNVTGLGSGTQITSGVQSAIGSTLVSVKAKPTVALASGSPSGTLTTSTAHQLAIFDVIGAGADDVTFASAQTNLFTIQIARKQGTSDYVAGNWVLKDGAGITLSTISVEDYDTSVTFLFGTNTFSVGPGETKKLYVYGDTHEYTTQYDYIQLWLSDALDANCSYSVNAGTTLPYGTKIFRGNIYGGTFNRP
ncbi:peptidoglycan-binding protein [Patescibacteria group bacterium]|nr:peptidoglycan-binding protein [Patescibacteria group bacterium]